LRDRDDVQSGPTRNRGIHGLAIHLSGLTLILLVAGALVTSNDAGDSVPDWPLSFGRWLIHSDNFVANVRYEYSHRFLAGIVGVTTFLLAVWIWLRDGRPWMRRLALVMFAGVVAQALIGGVRVLLPAYKPLIAVPHALIAQSFFGLVVSVVVFTSRNWIAARAIKSDAGSPSLRGLSTISVGAVLIQLVLGAAFRHQAFGIVPHIVGAVAVTVVVVWTSSIAIRRHGDIASLRRPAVVGIGLVFIQLCLGVGAYLARVASQGDPQPLEPMISLTAAHLVVGALTLATMLVLTLRAGRLLLPVAKTAEDGTRKVSPSEAQGVTV